MAAPERLADIVEETMGQQQWRNPGDPCNIS